MVRNTKTAAAVVQTVETETDTATLALYEAWETGLVDYAESLTSANDAKATAKDAKAAIDAIERRTLWAGFDYVRRTSNDPADAFALLVSQFVDVKDGENANTRRQYAMRARDAFRTEWQDAMSKADRSKASPLGVAAKLRRDAVKTAERQNTIAKAGPIAAAIAAEAIGSTPQGITNLIESGDTTHERDVSVHVQRYLDKPRIFDERLGVWVVGLRLDEPDDPWKGLKGPRTFEIRDRRNMPMRRVHARSADQVLDWAYTRGVDIGCVVEVRK